MLTRRSMLAGTAALAAAGPGLAQRRAAASGWYDRAIIVDALGGIGDPYAGADLMRLSDRAWAETVETGVTILRQTLMPVGNVADAWADFQKSREEMRELFSANPDRLIHIRSAADILKAKREKKFGVILGTQDTSMIGGALDRLAELKKDGVMTVQLTYNNRGLSGDGALEPGNAGISKLGKATIERIEAERILLDISHGGVRTMAEAAAHAKRPVVNSHTAARALYDHPRNTSDETIRAVADKGGVTGVYFMPFLRADSQPTGEDLIRHIEHVAKVAGEDGVGIGTDNGVLPLTITEESRKNNREWANQRIKAGIASPGEGPEVFPIVAEYNSVDRYRRLATVLEKRGWSQSRLEKLFGGNFVRVYRDAWGG